MTKAEMIQKVKAAMGGETTTAAAGKALDAVIDGITCALKADGAVTLTGIGTFKVKATAARTGRNPQTGKALQIPAGKKVAFSAAKALKDAVK